MGGWCAPVNWIPLSVSSSQSLHRHASFPGSFIKPPAQPVAAASHSCIFHNFKSNCNADFLIGKWEIVLCMTQLLRHYCQKGVKRRTKSGADTAVTVTSARPGRMENERRVRGKRDGANLICCITGESAHAVHCTSLYIT